MSSFASWLVRLKEKVIRPGRQTSHRRPARRRTYRPHVEELEPRLAPAAYAFDVLAAFESSLLTGGNPAASLIRDQSGDLFGTTTAGGSGFGTLFEQSPNGSGGYSPNTAKTLYTFTGGNDGAAPFGSLVEDTATGNLFGTTTAGGSGSAGTAFRVTPSGTLTTIYAFSGADGAKPFGHLVKDGSGDFFGTTEAGGANGIGTVFELSPPSSGSIYTRTTLYTFGTTATDGANPFAGLVRDAGGNLFGTTEAGGAKNAGTVFELVNSSGSYTLKALYAFGTAAGDGAKPFAGLIEDAGGNLFGTTQFGGANNDGTVFELVNSSGSYTLKTLYTFTGGSDGANPHAALAEDAGGNLFGTTQAGGSAAAPAGDGTVFELVNSSGSFTFSSIHAFTGSEGANPNGGLVLDSKADLFGTTFNAGAKNAGTLFELGTPQNIALASGNNQTGTAGTQLASPLMVDVTDANGNPVPGVTVTWAAAGGGGTVSAGTSTTNSSGLASINATLGTTAGTDTYTATVSGLTGSPVTFTETGTAGAAAAIASSSGNGQSATVNTQLKNALEVKVTDANGNPVAGTTVTWAVASGGGKVSTATSVTDTSGLAQVTATLGTTAGTDTYTATVSGLSGSPVTFTETATADKAATIALSSGNSQTGVAGQQLTNPLVVLVTDRFANPVSGVTVNWAAGTGGGSVSAATSTTNSSGLAQINATLGIAIGTDTFTAAAGGLGGSPITFTETVQSASAIISGEAAGPQGLVLGGLTLDLVGTTTSGQTVNETTTTNAAGFYNFHNLLPGTYQVKNGQTFLNSPGASITVADGQIVNQNIAFTSYVTGDISLRLFLNTTNYVGFASIQNNQPVVVNPIQNVSVTAGASPTVINLAGNFSAADLTDPIVTFSVSTGGSTPQTYAVELFGKLAPQTVANFLSYVESGEYNSTVFHRVQGPNSPSTPLRIIQGGGFSDNQLTAITTDPNVQSEFGISNTTNTLAMALTSAGPNSGNSEFFFNTADNSSSLNPQSFTVFGKVISSGDQTVLNALAQSMFTADSGSKFSNFPDIPVYNYSGSTLPGTATANNFAVLQSVAVSTPGADTFTYAIANSNPGLVNAVLGNNLAPADNNLLTLNYVAGATGSAVITVQATNQNGQSVTTSFTVTVT